MMIPVMNKRWLLLSLLIIGASLLLIAVGTVQATDDAQSDSFLIAGRLLDGQGQPIVDAEISAHFAEFDRERREIKDS